MQRIMINEKEMGTLFSAEEEVWVLLMNSTECLESALLRFETLTKLKEHLEEHIDDILEDNQELL